MLLIRKPSLALFGKPSQGGHHKIAKGGYRDNGNPRSSVKCKNSPTYVNLRLRAHLSKPNFDSAIRAWELLFA
jgi:hypothetical protein